MRKTRLIFLTLVILLLLAPQAWAETERAIWVWSMADDIVLDESGSQDGPRQTFFSFCAAPHGDEDRAITTVYLSGSVLDKDGKELDLVSGYVEELRGFLAAAHSRIPPLKVECLQGDKLWATPDYRGVGETRCNEIINFNKDSPSDSQRFDGIHYDVEPYLLSDDSDPPDPCDWDADNKTIWEEYLTLLENCQVKVNAYNDDLPYPDIKFGADIPWWYDIDGYSYDPEKDGFEGSPFDIQNRVDYVTIMDYRDTWEWLVDCAEREVTYADINNRKAFIGVETSEVYPPGITFYDDGNNWMEKQLAEVAKAFSEKTSFAGFAIHYYEDEVAGETGYRSLEADTCPGWHPVVKVLFPNGDNGIELEPGVTYNITWTAVDYDDADDELTITIEYSFDGGENWKDLASGKYNDSDGNGEYTWETTTNPTDYPDGEEYRIKVTATDDTLPTNLSGYDTSDYNFSFSGTPSPVPEWSSPKDTRIDGARPIIIPDGNLLHMVWYSPGWGGSPKGVYYKKSTDNGSSWGETVTLSKTDAISPRKPALAVNGSNLAVVWVEDAASAGDGKKVKVSTSSDGGNTWDITAAEVQGTYGSYKWADFPDVAIDSNNNIHVVWGARSTSGPWVIHYNSKVGGSWTGRYLVASTSYYIATPAITSDSNGAHVVYGEFNWSGGWKYIIRYRRNSGGWGSIKTIAQVGVVNNTWTKYFPDIYSDSSNKLHVVWQTAGANPQTDSSVTSKIRYASSANAGNSWQVMSGDLAGGYVPAVGVDDGELRVIYYVPSSTNELGDIRYRKSTDGGSNWSAEGTITTDARFPYGANDDSDVSIMVGFPNLASGSMVAAWRGYLDNYIMFSYKDMFGSPANPFANLVYDSWDSLKLSWKKPSDYTPNSYSLYRSENDQDYSSVATQIYDLEYTDDDGGVGLSSTSYYKYRVTAMEDAAETKFSTISNVLYPGENFLVDDFEEYEREGINYSRAGINYSKAGASDLTWSFDTVEKQEGNRSIKLNYTYVETAPPNWGAVLQGTFPTNLDISAYDIVRFWAKGGTVGNAGIAIQFREAGRPEGNETWTSFSPEISDAGWHQYEFYLSDFERTTAEKNDRFDRKSIGSYQLFFSKDTSDGTYYVDKIELCRAPPFLEVTPEVDFGTISGSVSNHRFQTTAINIKYSGFRPPWTVRVFTDNSPGNGPEPEKAGLKGVDDPLIYVPLKVWCGNYGPREFDTDLPHGPDEENDYFWRGYDFNGNGKRDDLIMEGSYVEADYGFDIDGDGEINDTITPTPTKPLSEEPAWLRIPERDEHKTPDEDPENYMYSWRRLCWNDGSLWGDAGLDGDFDIYLAVDTFGVKNQKYSTILTVEYINE